MAETQEKLSIEHEESRGKPRKSIERTGDHRTEVEIAAHKPDRETSSMQRAQHAKRNA